MSEFQYFGDEIAKNRAAARLSTKKRYRGLIGLGIGGAGLAAGMAGLPLTASVGIWALGMAAWAFLKAV